MSSYIMHLCISEKIRKDLNLGEKFLGGSVLPDLLKMTGELREKTHYIESVVKGGKIQQLPNIEKFKNDNTYITDKEVRLGYIAHLIEDYIWFSEYIPKYKKQYEQRKTKEDISMELYKDYNRLNKYIPMMYGLNQNNMIRTINNVFHNERYDEILMQNIYPRQELVKTENVYITKQDVENYIKEAYKKVKEELEKILGEE